MARANTVDQSSAEIPIAVDMDGTLILTDMSWVSIKRVILRRPWSIVGMLAKEFTGRRAQWKRDLAERLVFDPAELEYHEEFRLEQIFLYVVLAQQVFQARRLRKFHEPLLTHMHHGNPNQ